MRARWGDSMKEVMPYVLLPFFLLMTGLTWGLYWLVLRPITVSIGQGARKESHHA